MSLFLSVHSRTGTQTVRYDAVGREDSPMYCLVKQRPPFRTDRQHNLYHGVVCFGRLLQTSIVVKGAREAEDITRLQNEYRTYGQLQTLQGIAIPRCLGYFTCSMNKPDFPFECMILVDAGQTLEYALVARHLRSPFRYGHEYAFKDTPFAWRKSILEAFNKLHDAGFQRVSNCWSFDAIAMKNGHATVLSLGDAQPHQCPRPREAIVPESLRPGDEHFKCEELWYLTNGLGFWESREIVYLGDIYSIEPFLLEDDEFDYYALANNAPTSISDREAVECAIDAYVDYVTQNRPSIAEAYKERIAQDREKTIQGYVDQPVIVPPASPELEMLPWDVRSKVKVIHTSESLYGASTKYTEKTTVDHEMNTSASSTSDRTSDSVPAEKGETISPSTSDSSSVSGTRHC
ncbi:hypothetical protein EXIGLDRAFT_722293 [Exidia glandulosa HHB12029]|uniref:Uncharacterized protein n=1 Tax=Exidia glandulosa HHB12029 TaxID=1314781 RepID=A0A165N5A5_EXIGL|nr:hypothetical protein EXIGLDRAFT_722293 [Exidia glandulosa HHB12029]